MRALVVYESMFGNTQAIAKARSLKVGDPAEGGLDLAIDAPYADLEPGEIGGVAVTADVIRSNLALLRIIVGGRSRSVTSGFVSVPLDLTNPYGLAVLACIITATPGTIWMSYETQDRILLIHVFDLMDETEWIRTITERYAQPLQEIFA